MKIFILSAGSSVHTQRWIKGLSNLDIEIVLFSLTPTPKNLYEDNSNIQVIDFSISSSIRDSRKSGIAKLFYLKALKRIKSELQKHKPDILHAHYASSYGLLGALTGYHPYIISVWGADVYDFPNKSIFHKLTLKYSLSKANRILSTSKVMAKETNKYTSKNITVTPFGIDMKVFKPEEVRSVFDDEVIVIGTIKTLEKKYGIEYLIKAFKIVFERNRNLPLRLLIVGGGSQETELKELSKSLNLEPYIHFAGKVPFEEVPRYHKMLSVYVSLSVLDSESFGVAIIEASACETPVVVSNVGGLPEVVDKGITGLIVPPRKPDAAANAIETLVTQPELKEKMGKAGRERVRRLYDWEMNLIQMTNIYKETIKTNK